MNSYCSSLYVVQTECVSRDRTWLHRTIALLNERRRVIDIAHAGPEREAVPIVADAPVQDVASGQRIAKARQLLLVEVGKH